MKQIFNKSGPAREQCGRQVANSMLSNVTDILEIPLDRGERRVLIGFTCFVTFCVILAARNLLDGLATVPSVFVPSIVLGELHYGARVEMGQDAHRGTWGSERSGSRR